MSKISEFAEQQLTNQDTIVEQYRSTHNNAEGVLFLTKQRVLFLQPQGFLRKTYHVTRNLPYDTITRTTIEASHRFTMSTATDTFTFATIGIQADIVEDTLQHLIDSAKPKPTPTANAPAVKVTKTRKTKN
jgi:hypothetical protein